MQRGGSPSGAAPGGPCGRGKLYVPAGYADPVHPQEDPDDQRLE